MSLVSPPSSNGWTIPLMTCFYDCVKGRKNDNDEWPPICTEADFLEEIQTKVKSFPPCYSKSPLQSAALPWDFYFFKLTRPVTVSSTVHLLYTVNEKGGKPDRKPYPLPYGFRNPYRNFHLCTVFDCRLVYALSPTLFSL